MNSMADFVAHPQLQRARPLARRRLARPDRSARSCRRSRSPASSRAWAPCRRSASTPTRFFRSSASTRATHRGLARGRNDLMAIKPGWTGRVFEDFTVGDVYEHPLGRTITQADNVWFTCLTMNTNPIHFDAEYASHTEFKRPLVNSCFTLALVTGQSVIDLTMNGVANLGWDDVQAAAPALRGRHGLREERGARDARVEIAADTSASSASRPPACNQDGDGRHRVHADVHDLEARARADDARSHVGSLRTMRPSDARGTRVDVRASVVEIVDAARTARAPAAAFAVDSARAAHARNFASSSASLAGRSG